VSSPSPATPPARSVIRMRKTLLITTLTGLAAATATATFPGRNGLIACRAGALPVPPGVPWPLFVARADGTREHELSNQPGGFADWRADGRRVAFDGAPVVDVGDSEPGLRS
jgi:hypothetical protein